MRMFWTAAILIGIALVWLTDSPGRPLPGPVVDVSWPNCQSKLTNFGTGIVGIDGGLAFRKNPCAAQQAGFFKVSSVYLNTGYPGIKKGQKYHSFPKDCSLKDNDCLAYNYGYQSGQFDVNYALASGALPNIWWLDVENANSWTDYIKTNRQVLLGKLDAINRLAHGRVGYYSYPAQWDILTGKWRNGLPAWVATGSTKPADARVACTAPSFTGGPVIYAQFTMAFDFDVTCQ